MELSRLKPLYNEYEDLVLLLQSGISNRDDWITSVYKEKSLVEDQLSECEKTKKDLVKENKRLTKSNKSSTAFNKVLAVAGGVLIMMVIAN